MLFRWVGTVLGKVFGGEGQVLNAEQAKYSWGLNHERIE